MKMHICLLSLLLVFTSLLADEDGLVAWWQFDENGDGIVIESVGQVKDSVAGFHKHVKGISGQALLYDGYTTVVRRSAPLTKFITNEFTIEAWVAFQAYPWNWVGIVDHKTKDSGYQLSVNANGLVRLEAFIDEQLISVTSTKKIELLKWTHMAAVFDEEKGLIIYINGKEAEKSIIKGLLTTAKETDILIGRSHEKLAPAYPIRMDLPASYSFDGIIDEVKIYNRSLSGDNILKQYQALKPSDDFALSFRKLPAGPDGPGRFGAYYTKLKFSETWDEPWRVGDHADVVVRFDEAAYKFIFWRGTSYIPFWVTENGIWYTNEFNETWGEDVMGCAEPMSDKQTRQSHVRIIESNDARVIVHWRYALVDNRGIIAKTDPVSGWGDWSDEYYVIYPDGVGLRKIHLWTSEPTKPHQFQEAIILNPPGTTPEDNIEVEAITMANMEGETHTYSWAEGAPQVIDKPEKFNIQFINLKSKSIPFVIVNEGKPGVTRRGIEADGPWIRPYSGEINREYSIFPWWNHWPVAQIPSDGRWATEPDRVSHSSLSNDLEWEEIELTDRTHVRVMMHGLTAKSPKEILPLANSWLYPPDLKIQDDVFRYDGYLAEERAYVVSRVVRNSNTKLSFTLMAGPDAPLVNPAFVIKNWGATDARLFINQKEIKRGKKFRYGFKPTLESDDLVVWLKLEAKEPMEFLFQIVDEDF